MLSIETGNSIFHISIIFLHFLVFDFAVSYIYTDSAQSFIYNCIEIIQEKITFVNYHLRNIDILLIIGL